MEKQKNGKHDKKTHKHEKRKNNTLEQDKSDEKNDNTNLGNVKISDVESLSGSFGSMELSDKEDNTEFNKTDKTE